MAPLLPDQLGFIGLVPFWGMTPYRDRLLQGHYADFKLLRM